ncbi:WW domain-binding [Brachionus plicatilis]|uniref:WW domain-binding n=1 Tax=Brachionus plicatilis TaxID=10195 RepID=A0A3M7RJI1_BRAPC|nr:WW domain-binding [Brachionus plicatilis]
MGKRSTSSTKSGKFMNPTDQARKQERRKELKKNKLQRKLVRESVIKQKDPKQILASLDELDKLEYDPNTPPPYSTIVIQEKRRKLKSELRQIINYYGKEDAKLSYELRQMESDYDKRSQEQKTFHQSILQAKKVKVDDIPLPDTDQPADPTPFLFPYGMPPPPPVSSNTPKSILKSNDFVMAKFPKEPPGPPSAPPPDLSEFHLDDDEFELGLTVHDKIPTDDRNKKIRFAPEPVHGVSSVMPPPPPPVIPAYAQPAQLKQPAYSPALQAKIQQQAQLVKQQIYQQSLQQQNQTGGQLTIEAKPVLRNKAAEVTKFVPTSVIVKRPGQEQPKHEHTRPYDYTSHYEAPKQTVQSSSTKSTDAAYEEFMKEVSGFL